MRNYTTFIQRYKKTTTRVTNKLDFLLNKGEAGTIEDNLLKNRYTKTLLTEGSKEKIKNSIKKSKFNNTINIRDIAATLNYYARYIKEGKFKYTQFEIPKRSGGTRIIQAPTGLLKSVQTNVAALLKYKLGLLPHDIAHGYIEERSIKTNAQMHQRSNHFMNVDLKNFFPSWTKTKIIQVLQEIGIFGLDELQNSILDIAEIACYQDKLPQGSPLSPFLSNILMIPFDYHLQKLLMKKYPKIVVTRYVDDITFSSFNTFANSKEESKELGHNIIKEALKEAYGDEEFLEIQYEKTKVTTKAGKNRVTGIKINKDNNLSIGYKEKRLLKQDLANLIIRHKNGTLNYGSAEIEQVFGYLSFLKSIEPDYANYLENTVKRKFNIASNINLQRFLQR